jgi:hypothetical protein
LRARPEETDFTVAKFLTNLDARVRADAANTLSRVRAKNANEQLRAMLLSDNDAIARANAARALGAAEDKDSFNILMESAIFDDDSRVRVSAIRSLGSLKDAKAAEKLLERGEKFGDYKKSKFANPSEKSELLEIAATLGRLLANSDNQSALKFLNEFNQLDSYQSSETEIAIALIAPKSFYQTQISKSNEVKNNWQTASIIFQAASSVSAFYNSGENQDIKTDIAKDLLKSFSKLNEIKNGSKNLIYALPELIRFYAQLKQTDLPQILREHLTHKDTIVRATAAELLSDLGANKENISALINALPQKR